jgi:hypothetical protein
MAFVPIAIGWLAVYALVGIARWIATGFRREQ